MQAKPIQNPTSDAKAIFDFISLGHNKPQFSTKSDRKKEFPWIWRSVGRKSREVKNGRKEKEPVRENFRKRMKKSRFWGRWCRSASSWKRVSCHCPVTGGGSQRRRRMRRETHKFTKFHKEIKRVLSPPRNSRFGKLLQSMVGMNLLNSSTINTSITPFMGNKHQLMSILAHLLFPSNLVWSWCCFLVILYGAGVELPVGVCYSCLMN